MRRLRGTRAALLSSSGAPAVVFTTLPQAGPFAGLTETVISGLSNLTISSNSNAAYSDELNPLVHNVVTLNASRILTADGNGTGNLQLWLWCNTLIFNSSSGILGNGDDGITATDPFQGGQGGNGAFGGGGGAGTIGPGSSGTDLWTEITGSAFAPAFTIGNGGDSTYTSGSLGRGGGGAGSLGDEVASGGGGGGGAGCIVIVANTITGNASAFLRAFGGSPGLDSDNDLFANSGGGGVIYLGARAYNGLISTSNVLVGGGSGSNGGTKTIQQINANMSVTTKAFNNSWIAA